MKMCARIRHYSPAVKLFLLSGVAFGIGTGIFDVVYNLHLLEAGLTANHIGTLFLISLAVMAAGAIPTGLLADRFGRRWFLLGGSFVFGVTVLALPWTSDVRLLALFQGLNALGGIVMFTTESSTMAGEVPPGEAPAFFSLVFTNYLFWTSVGSLLGGQIPAWFQIGSISQFQGALLISGGFCTLISVIRLFMRLRPEPLGGRVRQRRLAPTLPMLQLALLAALVGASATLGMRFINVILQGRYHLSTSQIGVTIVLIEVFSFLGAMVSPAISNRLGTAGAAVLLMILAFPLLLAAAISEWYWVFILPFLLRQGLHYAQMPLLETYAVAMVDPADRSTMSSYRQVGFFLGGAVSAKMYGAILAGVQFGAALAISGLFAVLAGVCYWAFYGRTAASGSTTASAP